MNIWKNKKVLITGSEGMIGKELIEQLKRLKAKVILFDKKIDVMMDVTYKLRLENTFFIERPDYVISCFGIKGNPRMTAEHPVDFMYPMLVGDANLIYLAQKYKVKRFLYTSSIAVENPETDKYPAWSKQTAETLIEAMKVQYPKGTQYCIVRPCNVYGRFDDLNREHCMVISDLIRKGIKNKKIELWNTGNDERDFLNAKDCARGMIEAIEQMPDKPVNLCSGKGIRIKDIAHKISKELNVPLILGKKTKKTRRVMKLNWNFKPQIDIDKGLYETIKYIKENYK